MKKLRVRGDECSFFIENTGDGGAVINSVVPDPDHPGEYKNFREWFSNPDVARQRLRDMTTKDAESRADKARLPGMSGVRQVTKD